MGVTEAFGEGQGMGIQMPSLNLDPSLTTPITPTAFGDTAVSEAPFVFGQQDPYEFGSEYEMEEGGQVPQQQQLMALLALAQMQQQDQTAYSGTALEEEKQQSTIADMFASQGKSLDGNNTQSLSQMLGR